MRIHNEATGAYADVPDKAVRAYTGLLGWSVVDPEPPVEHEDTAEDNKSRGKSSARTTKKD
jgi:hypothetical protein